MSPSDMFWPGRRSATICIVDVSELPGVEEPMMDLDEMLMDAEEEADLPPLLEISDDEESIPELEYEPIREGYLRATDDEMSDEESECMDMDTFVDHLGREDFTFYPQ